ncbi:type VII toxin-antitoxin system MntA family adenylyltransferase antitoxin [Spirochaeta isovalerica]|uniref:Putative nucleotidyltransferase n=1 Tax=Spirochaeta isovalerica TaxID=150 RepID=A0A841R812_9SPIO|nr:nucleotidyltransferase domain-containing protein [Spirochaeta isovalerica]MBB6479511.1 putative nucleotidyltransferase [Spirochaeta isovalerica]
MIEKIQTVAADIFRKYDKVVAVFLLGSAATSKLRPDSDIDMALLTESGKKILPSDFLSLSSSLSYEFSRTVDLGIISSKNLIYAREALLKGIPVFVRDEDKMNLLRANLLGMYIQFNEDRREIVEAYASR